MLPTYFIGMFTHAHFLGIVEAYLERSGMKPATFGRKAVGDPTFVFDIRRGRSPSLAVVERVQRFIADNPPPGDRAPRPAASPAPEAA
ncbi:MAG TPA: hypothetical protein VF194_15145 [Ferrovibrio sp.]|uniref:hypothetical protein n=1 Tax=Ferrovibrio sp. TaxID=1917215 RepID=UPI002ECFB1CD